MHLKLRLSSALMLITFSGAAYLSATSGASAEYAVTCYTNEPMGASVSYSPPCDGQSAYLACVEASTYCGMSLEVSLADGSSNCVATCRLAN